MPLLPPFLRSDGAAWRWAQKNIDMDLSQWGLEMEDVEARARTYAAFARSAEDKKGLDIYRAVRARRIADVHLRNLGKSWSRYAKAAASYAGASEWKPMVVGGRRTLQLVPLYNELLIHGRVSPRAVDWEQSFRAFMFWGQAQWEVTLLPHVPVSVVSIRDRDTGALKTFRPPVAGDSGFGERGKETGWRPTPSTLPGWEVRSAARLKARS